jgi:hypothetical protein
VTDDYDQVVDLLGSGYNVADQKRKSRSRPSVASTKGCSVALTLSGDPSESSDERGRSQPAWTGSS